MNSLGLGEEDSFRLEVTGESLPANSTPTNCSPAKVLDASAREDNSYFGRGADLRVPGELLALPHFSQVECSPLCGITWILGEADNRVPEELTGDSDLYTIEEMVVEQSEDQFSFVKSTLTLHEARDNLTQFSVSCR